ncbi:PrpF domain-containing protein [Cupriavidus basilensis]
MTVDATLTDNGMLMVLLRASDLGRTGYGERANPGRRRTAEGNAGSLAHRSGQAGHRMGLGRRYRKELSRAKMCLIAPPRAGGSLTTRCFIPHVCHEAIGVLAAVTVGTACVLPHTVAQGIAEIPGDGPVRAISVEHPTGEPHRRAGNRSHAAEHHPCAARCCAPPDPSCAARS